MAEKSRSRTQRSINPATGEQVAEYKVHSAREVDQCLALASRAFVPWSQTKLSERTKHLTRVAKLLGRKEEEYARRVTLEMGKPIKQSRSEIQKCRLACEFYAVNASSLLADEKIATDASLSQISYEPLGAILAIMPWNFPFWQVIRFAAPSLAAGNVALLKHASNVPGCALALQELFLEAGLPDGVFTSLLVDSSHVERIIKDPIVKAATLTGSEGAGRAVGAAAGGALKKVVLELGGSDAFIVLDDADIDLAASAAVTARTQNAGQSCIAAKRFIVTKKISQAFTKALTKKMEALKIGDPMLEETDVGPLVSANAVKEIHKMVTSSLRKGGRLVCGGKPLRGSGFYYEPTVIADVGPGYEVFDEETFGPVAAVTTVRNVDEAIDLANRTRFGLGASIWTSNKKAALGLVRRIEAGSVFINGIVKSDPRLPFGGVKASGHGRELSAVGIREFTNIKTVWSA